MASLKIKDRILEQLEILPEDLQERVLAFTISLVPDSPRGTPGEKLLRLVGTLSPEEARRMEEAIEEGCERVDPRDW